MYSKLITALLLIPSVALAFTLTTANMKGWEKDEVKFHFNPANCGADTSRVESAIRAAVDLWNGVPTSRLRLTYVGQTSNSGLSAEPIVSCATSGISGTIGVGIITTLGGAIQTAEIQMNKEASDSGDIANITDGQLEYALAHEMGHVFGLGHSTAETSMMYYSISRKTQMNLAQDDIDGITWLYGRTEPKDGFLGCGALNAGGGHGGAGLLWVLAFAGLVALGLRRRSPPLASGF